MRHELVSAVSEKGAVFNPPPRDPRLTQFLTGYPPSLFSETLYQSIELMERYSVELALDLLVRLHLPEQLDQWRSPDELCRVRGFRPQFHFALEWLLRRAVETDCLECRNEAKEFRLLRLPRSPQRERLRAIGLEISSLNAPALDLLDQAARLYPAVARGEQSGEQALFAPDGIPLWLRYFHNDNLTYAVNNWVTAVLAADCVATVPSVSILELGAGGGSATEIILRWFDERGILPRIKRYLVTEPNAFFRRRGQRELTARFPHVQLEWSALDINQPWDSQGVSAGDFDLVFGVNVLHVAGDLLFSLGQAHRALTPEGWLVLGECVRPFPRQPLYPELVFQILDSFTAIQLDPAFRPNPGFLTPEQWHEAFTRAGFVGWELRPDIERIREIYPHFSIAALRGQRALSV